MSDIKALQTSEVGRDADGIRVGEWEVGLFGCFTDCVPNCLMASCLPCISVAQISSRLGIYKYSNVLLVSLWAYVLVLSCCALVATLALQTADEAVQESADGLSRTLGPVASTTAQRASNVLQLTQGISIAVWLVYVFVLFQLRSETRERFEISGNYFVDVCCISMWCNCCSIAQIATHGKSYKPRSCDFCPVETLPGYTK